MENIGIFALIVLVFASIKIITILISPKSWLNFIDRLWNNPKLVMVVALIGSVWVYSELIKVISIKEIFATILLVALLSALTMAVYAKEFVAMAHKLLSNGALRKGWLAILIWAILIVLGFLSLF
ncbi:MAG: hypothetical protein AABX11_02970 [Nanoarchaeota archaeon]